MIPRQYSGSRNLFARANRIMPGGVNSPVRAFRAVGGIPRYFVCGRGSRVWDSDGNDYVDLVGAWGPSIVGHAHPAVVDRVQRAVAQGLGFGAPHPDEIVLTEEIHTRVPAAERVRLVSTGTEAVMSAIRLARAVTGRTKIIMFEGCYHGHSDAVLATGPAPHAPREVPSPAGITAGTSDDTIVLPYNDQAALSQAVAQYGRQLAAIITEPIAANMGVVLPAAGWNARIAELCREAGALLILDEVITGFRVGPGGYTETVARGEGWTPDLITFGKVIGGGLPVAALAGRAEVMGQLAPLGPVYQAGTLSGNPVATAAGIATLGLLDPAAYRTLHRNASEVQQIISTALARSEVRHCVPERAGLFSVFLGVEQVRNRAEAQLQRADAYAAFFHAFLDHGVYVPPSGLEAWFVSTALVSADLERVCHAAVAAARAAACILRG